MPPFKNIFAAVILCFIDLFCFAQQPTVIKGIADLRHVDLSLKDVTLKGEWKFFPEQLISAQYSSASNTFFTIPALWNGHSINGKELSDRSYASYAATVLLPEKHTALAIEVPDAYSSLVVFINGKKIFESGTPDSSENRSVPFWKTGTIPLQVTEDTLNIVLHVANYWHYKAGLNEPLVIGDADRLLLKREQTEAFDLLLTGCLFMGGLFFFGLYLFGKHDKAILFFSLFCMLYSYRIIGTDMYTLHSIFPNLSWFFTIRLEYLSLYIGIALFVRYTRHLYPDDVHKPVMNALTGFCLLFALTVLLPPYIFTQFVNLFLVVMFLYIGYAFYIYWRAVRRNRLGSQYALISTAVVLFVFAIINLAFFQLIPPMKGLVFFGYILFFFLQSLILSYRFAATLQQAKQQAEEGLAAKSAFLSTMSHEIRTPLNSVIGTAHIMLKNQPRNDQKEHLNILLYSANNLLRLVNDILDFNKIEANKIEFETIPMDPVEICNSVAASLLPMAQEKGLQIEKHFDNTVPWIFGDPTRLGQVLMNLIHNAVKFTERGSVAVALTVSEEDAQNVSLRFSVTDTGIGIPSEKQMLIFDQFTQADSSTSRSFGGTGLGLAITKRIIEQQGGYLSLKSVPDIGSEFYFTLRFKKASAPNIEKPIDMNTTNTPNELPLQNISVLLVEDNALNVFVAKSFLEQWGANVDVAENGRLAIDLLDPNKHRIVLMDMHMPVMDGYEAVEILRGKGIQTPIIALTASISKEAESKVMKVGANSIIVKPFDPDTLLNTVKRYVRQ